MKDDLKEAGETVLADSRELVRAAGAVLNDAFKTVKEDFKAFKDEVAAELTNETVSVKVETETDAQAEEVKEQLKEQDIPDNVSVTVTSRESTEETETFYNDEEESTEV